MHLLTNLISQMIFGLALEKVLGRKSTIILYFVSAFGGVLLSSLLSESIAVGASTAIFGIFACYISFLIINWEAMSVYGTFRYTMICIILLIMLLNFVSGSMAKDTIDNWGHLGGLATGLALGFVIIKPMGDINSHRRCRSYSLVILSACLLVCFICFYTINDPQP